jgi:hypothetical protein
VERIICLKYVKKGMKRQGLVERVALAAPATLGVWFSARILVGIADKIGYLLIHSKNT